MKKISVIGSGTMGNGIAHCFAQHGFNVNLVDISLDNLKKASMLQLYLKRYPESSIIYFLCNSASLFERHI